MFGEYYFANTTAWTVDGSARVLLRFADKPYRSGYVPGPDLERFAGAPLLAVMKHGNGNIIFMQEDFNYRAYWLATNHILTNAILFGDLL